MVRPPSAVADETVPPVERDPGGRRGQTDDTNVQGIVSMSPGSNPPTSIYQRPESGGQTSRPPATPSEGLGFQQPLGVSGISSAPRQTRPVFVAEAPAGPFGSPVELSLENPISRLAGAAILAQWSDSFPVSAARPPDDTERCARSGRPPSAVGRLAPIHAAGRPGRACRSRRRSASR
jgi:hypothetical protein